MAVVERLERPDLPGQRQDHIDRSLPRGGLASVWGQRTARGKQMVPHQLAGRVSRAGVVARASRASRPCEWYLQNRGETPGMCLSVAVVALRQPCRAAFSGGTNAMPVRGNNVAPLHAVLFAARRV